MNSLRPHRSLQRAGLLGLLALALAACANEGGSSSADVSLRTGTPVSIPLAISLAGDDVVLDWSAAGITGSATVYRSTDPGLLAELRAGGTGDGVELLVGSSATSFTDAGAASRSQATPTYYYALVVENNQGRFVSAMGMKISTAMAPGYNKMAVCMDGGPSRASDVAARLGSSVTGVWGWDAASQSYISWTPAQGVGTDSDFVLPLGSVFAAQVDGSTPAFQSLVGLVPSTNDDFTVSARPGYNWGTLPVSYEGATSAAYWVGQAGYWGVGRWNNLTQSQSWYWSAQDPDFDLEVCRPHYTYLPPNACASNDDCSEDAFCYFVDAAACGDAAAGLCKARPIGCEEAAPGEVCGCDGVTYGSACEAEQAGATVASEGECPVVEVDECQTVVCQNGGACSDQPGDGTWECDCAPGYTGTFCEIDIDECESSPCINGDCHDLINGWECDCAPGYTGTSCEIDIDECESNPCINGDCHDLINGWECDCAPGYTGTSCEIDIDECESNPCINGDCHDLINGWECDCAPGFTGTSCEIEQPVEATCPCSGGISWESALSMPPGEIVDDGEYVYAFSADSYGYLAAHSTQGSCEGLDWNAQDMASFETYHTSLTSAEVEACTDIIRAWVGGGEADPCADAPCQNGGTCNAAGTGYTCACPPGFAGTHCEVSCPCDPDLSEVGAMADAWACIDGADWWGDGVIMYPYIDGFLVEDGIFGSTSPLDCATQGLQLPVDSTAELLACESRIVSFCDVWLSP